MNWLFLAILSPMLYAAVNFGDKFILKGVINDYHGMPVYSAINNIIYGTLFWIVYGSPRIPFDQAVIILLTGIISVCASFLYFKAVYKEVTSKVIVLMQMVPLLVLGLSVIFLKEEFTFNQLVGFFFILVATIGLVLPPKDGIRKRGLSFTTFLTIFIACNLWAVSSILLKVLVETHSVGIIFIYQSWGIGIGGSLIYLLASKSRKSFINSLKSVGIISFIIVFLNEGVFIIGKVLNLLALSAGSVTLVSILGNTQAFFGIIFGRILTHFAPNIYGEEVDTRGLIRQLFYTACMFIGILFL